MDPCTTNERCDSASRTCLFDPLDGDRDGIPPRVCGGGDCDDSNANVKPGALELCNGIDDNCDGSVDELLGSSGHENCLRRACVAGRCTDTCLAAYASCGTPSSPYCADLQTDSAHCGRCGNACPSGGRCNAGRCECPSGATLCSASGRAYCARLDSDSTNCGACGMSCGGAAGMVCTMGRCACAAGNSLCGGRCTNLATDRNNCGACGMVCTGTQYCSAGVCAPLVCAYGEIACNGECFDPMGSWEHCGGCGRMCPAGRPGETYTFCDEGGCLTSLVGQRARCSSGKYPCEGSRGVECVDGQTNSHHCGSCNFRCSPGQVCTAARCVAAPVGCSAGQMLCSGTCIDTQTNVENCGGCGIRCNCCGSTAGTCVAGNCQYSSCPMAQVVCSGAMTCTFSDPRNCGACGRACMSGQTCSRGACL
ncbi:MAG: hypothetical protein JNK05_11795 [Myxococcales bacterium]|nr:hypothetical protein [Myxococcales bacterium]